MKPANIITLVTEDSLQLDAILFGSPNAKVGFVFIHGLSSSAFSHTDILPGNDNYISLYINNRGHDELTGIKRMTPETEKGYDWFPGGSAHEVFTDCVRDIQAGVDYLKGLGVRQIYLVGHSTGCQKSVYYLAQPNKEGAVSGVILICPMSDYAYALHTEGLEKLATATRYAQKMVEQGKQSALIPEGIWQEPVDAQRFISLYTPDSAEEIFTYGQPDKAPTLLKKISIPLLVLIAENDEYADRSTSEIARWFEKHTNRSFTKMIKSSPHGLTGKAEDVLELIT